MKRLVAALLALLAPVLPWGIRRGIYHRVLGFDIAPAARIGIAFVLPGHLRMGEGAVIGHFTIIRSLDRVEMGREARIGTFNWIFGMPSNSGAFFADEPDRLPVLRMGEGSALTSRHIVDCTNLVEIGAFATVAGFRSQLLTHGIDIATNQQRSAPIVIGDYAMVGSGVIVLKGARLGRGSVVGAGSVLRGALDEEYTLYAGNPAAAVKALDPQSAYFLRKDARVGPYVTGPDTVDAA